MIVLKRLLFVPAALAVGIVAFAATVVGRFAVMIGEAVDAVGGLFFNAAYWLADRNLKE